jgi:hypothetical protein
MTPDDRINTVEAPSLQQLNRATLFAAAGAAAILVVAVLPAEYGIDPTGLGRMLGLTPMGEMKQADAALDEAAAAPAAVAAELPPADVAPAPAPPAPAAPAMPTVPAPASSPVPAVADARPAAAKPAPAPAEQRGEVVLTLAPNQGREVKALMKAGDSFRYDWKTDGAEVRFELHGERLDASDGAFSSYEKGASTGQNGNFTAPFDGTHGWYWRNRTDKPVTITVRASGVFQRFAAVE